MSFSGTTNITQTGRITTTTSSASTNSTTIAINSVTVGTPSTANSVYVGMILDTPASCKGRRVTAITATQITLDLAVSVSNGDTITFLDSDETLKVFLASITPGTGLSFTQDGTDGTEQLKRVFRFTTNQLIINGGFHFDAKYNQYIFTGTQPISIVGAFVRFKNLDKNTQSKVLGNSKNIVSGVGQASSGNFWNPSQSLLNISGVSNIEADGVILEASQPINIADNNTSAPILRINNSTIKLGWTPANQVNLFRSDQSSTFAPAISLNNVTFEDSILSLSRFNNQSVYTGLAFIRSNFPTSARRQDKSLFAIQFNGSATFIGANFDPNYDSDFVSADPSIATTAAALLYNFYGLPTGHHLRNSSVIDWGLSKVLVELRKVIQITCKNSAGQAIPSAYMYFEDITNNSGEISVINIANQGAGLTNGNYSNVAITSGGGTGATMNITVTGGIVTEVVPSNAGSGYSDTQSMTYTAPSWGGTTQPTFSMRATRRRGTANGIPSYTAQKTYSATTDGAGLLKCPTNPTPPNRTAYTGIDLLLGVMNYLTSCAGNIINYAYFDYRFTAPRDAVNPQPTNFVFTRQIRAYLYNDYSLTINANGLSDINTQTEFLVSDDYAVATGITETQASAFTDITLSVAGATRNATTNAIIPVGTGTLNISATERNLNQIYAKAKRDYVQPVLTNDNVANTNATGFGLASFLTPTGATNNAILDIGSWNLVTLSEMTTGSVFKTLKTTGNVTLATNIQDTSFVIQAKGLLYGGNIGVIRSTMIVNSIIGLAHSGVVIDSATIGGPSILLTLTMDCEATSDITINNLNLASIAELNIIGNGGGSINIVINGGMSSNTLTINDNRTGASPASVVRLSSIIDVRAGTSNVSIVTVITATWNFAGTPPTDLTRYAVQFIADPTGTPTIAQIALTANNATLTGNSLVVQFTAPSANVGYKITMNVNATGFTDKDYIISKVYGASDYLNPVFAEASTGSDLVNAVAGAVESAITPELRILANNQGSLANGIKNASLLIPANPITNTIP